MKISKLLLMVLSLVFAVAAYLWVSKKENLATTPKEKEKSTENEQESTENEQETTENEQETTENEQETTENEDVKEVVQVVKKKKFS